MNGAARMSVSGAPRRRRAPDPARAAQERRLLCRYHSGGDLAARRELIERFLPLARRLAARYRRSGQPLEDLVQVAALGLVKAVDRFEPDRGSSFSSYAVPNILGELRRHFRDTGWAVHVPRSVKDRALQVEDAASELSRSLGRGPSPQEVAEATGEDIEDVIEAIGATAAHHAVSLDAPRASGEDEGETRGDGIGEVDGGYELIEDSATIRPALAALPERDRQVLKLRFEDDLTQTEIAGRIGVSQMHVSRILRRSLDRLGAAARGKT